MIEIYFSDSAHGEEIELSGSPESLRGVQQSILDLLQDEKSQVCVIQANIVDPAPYERCLISLLIRKTDSSISVSVSDESLQIEGEPEKLKIFSNWFDFDDDTGSGYHCHFDHLGKEEWVDPASSALVLSVKNSTKHL
jgi:hypothetical protein